jgi:hypothetical protein
VLGDIQAGDSICGPCRRRLKTLSWKYEAVMSEIRNDLGRTETVWARQQTMALLEDLLQA